MRGGENLKLQKTTLSRIISEQRQVKKTSYKELSDKSGVNIHTIRGYGVGSIDNVFGKAAKVLKAMGYRLCIAKEKDRTGGNQHGLETKQKF